MCGTIIAEIEKSMQTCLSSVQMEQLHNVLLSVIGIESNTGNDEFELTKPLETYIAAKRVEGCSEKTLRYYESTLRKMLLSVGKPIKEISTDDLRVYLDSYQRENNASKVTVDNVRRILSSFFSWMEEETLILKSPVRRIHKVQTGQTVKETYTDEALEIMRDHCECARDLALIDLLAATGMRVGELVLLNRDDIDFTNRECIVLGKGNKQRKAYFDARAKIHLQNYLNSRTDENPALFVSLQQPHDRLQIRGIEIRLHELGERLNLCRIHPHKFRRTLATMAIDKGMPIEQVQQLLGHQSVDTTLQYAMVNQANVKQSHRKFIA